MELSHNVRHANVANLANLVMDGHGWQHCVNNERSGLDGYDQRNASYNSSAVLQITSTASCAA